MPELTLAHTLLAAWDSYYVIVGSSAAALIGLQFVVIVLIADVQSRSNDKQIAAFGTPNVVHFVAALVVSAVLSAPWHTMFGPRLALGATGVAGLIYAMITAKRATHQGEYKLVLEDWIWHVILPIVAYAGIALSTMFLVRDAEDALFAIGGAALLFLFIGIHNAWDTVTYVASGEWRKLAPQKPATNHARRKK